MAQLVPTTNAPNQTAQVTLQVNGAPLTLTLGINYNRIAQFWTMTVADANGAILLGSVPLITGAWPAANILAPYEYLGIGSAFVINQNGATTDWPTDTNLGSGFALIWDN